MTELNEYDTAVITNVRRGKTMAGQHNIYAELRNASGELLIGATLDYIVEALLDRQTKTESKVKK